MQPLTIDAAGREDLDAYPLGAAEHSAEEALPIGRRELLRVVEVGQRPGAMGAERLGVEQPAGHDEGPGERPAPRLVGTGHEARAEPAVETKEPLAGSRHGGRG